MYKNLIVTCILFCATVLFAHDNNILNCIDDTDTKKVVLTDISGGSQVFTRLSNVLKYGIPARLLIMWASEVAKDYQRYGIGYGASYTASDKAYELLFLYCGAEAYYFLGDKVKYLDNVVDWSYDQIMQRFKYALK